MSCNLYKHLEHKRTMAEARRESAEVARLSQEIIDHCEECVTCAGVQSLVDNLFGGRAVIVTDGKGGWSRWPDDMAPEPEKYQYMAIWNTLYYREVIA